MIGRLSAIPLVVLAASAPVQAENWRAASTNGIASAFIDADSIRREGDRVTFWREVRWPEAQQLADGMRYNRLAALYEGDCGARTMRSISIRAKLDDAVVLSGDRRGEIEQIQPGSTADVDLRAACFGEWPRRR